jgi:hypothetical protein
MLVLAGDLQMRQRKAHFHFFKAAFFGSERGFEA